MRGTFGNGLARLKEDVGAGRLRGSVEVDQVYAHYQHEGIDFYHPDGGEPFFLRDPLFAKGPHEYMRKLAENLITEKGSDVEQAMIDNMEDLSDEVYKRAPWEFADLRASGHPVVQSGQKTIYDRPPRAHRLTPEEIKEKHELSELFWPDRYDRRNRGRL